MSVQAATDRSIGASLSDFLDEPGDLRAVELLRIAAGPIVIAHLWPFLQRAADGLIYSDRFYQPYVGWYPEAPRSLYLVLLWLTVIAAAALSLGAATRVAAAYTAGFVAYNLFLTQTHFSNNRVFLLVLLVGVAALPLGRRWSVDNVLRRRAGQAEPLPQGPLWPLLLLRFEVVAVFLSSGLSKLIDPDWWGGTVTRLRFEQGRAMGAEGLPDWFLDFVTTQGFHAGLAKVAVLTELAIGLGLVFRRTRLGAVWLAVCFHVAIEIIFSVQVFSYAALAALVIWVTPSVRDRTVVLRGETAGVRVVGAALRWLDWTGRFHVRRLMDEGPAMTLVDRDGAVYTGAAAARKILSRLPAAFWPTAPANLRGVRRLWDRATAGLFGPPAGRSPPRGLVAPG